MRGVPFIEGSHDFRIATGGIKVFPRLPAPEERTLLKESNTTPPLGSGICELDQLIGGPIPWGFGVMITWALRVSANLRWRRSLPRSSRTREKSVHVFVRGKRDDPAAALRKFGYGATEAIKKGNVELRRIDPSHITPGRNHA